MKYSRERKLRAIERWEQEKSRKMKRAMTAMIDLASKPGSKKIKGKKMHEINSEKDVTLRKCHVETKQWRSQITPEANTAYQSNQ